MYMYIYYTYISLFMCSCAIFCMLFIFPYTLLCLFYLFIINLFVSKPLTHMLLLIYCRIIHKKAAVGSFVLCIARGNTKGGTT